MIFKKSMPPTAALAAQKLAIDEAVINQGLANAKWPGRLQKLNYNGVGLWIDSAHNPGGAVVLAKELQPGYLIIGMMQTKDVSRFISQFDPAITKIITVPIVGEEKCYSPRELAGNRSLSRICGG